MPEPSIEALSRLGWAANLIPVIPPDATIAVGSAVPERYMGKVPGRRLPNETWQPYPDWQNVRATALEVARWKRWGGSIGLICHDLRAFDIDCDDPAICAAIETFLIQRTGVAAPKRSRPGTSRCLLVYRVGDGRAGAKLKLPFHTPGGVKAEVEVLGWGNQFVAYGRHRDGGSYTWIDGQGPAEQPPSALPEIAEGDVGPLMDGLTAMLGGLGCMTGRLARAGNGVVMLRGADRMKLGDPRAVARDIEQAGRALLSIPNVPVLEDGSPNEHSGTHDLALAIAAAFVGAVGGDGEAIERYLVPWYQQWPGNDDAYIRARIASLREGTHVGADRLFACARTWGFQEVPAGEFEPLPGNVVQFDERPVMEASATGTAEAALPVYSPRFGEAWSDAEMAAHYWSSTRGTVALHPSGEWLRWDGTQWYESRDAVADDVRRYLRSRERYVEGTGSAAILRWMGASERAFKIMDVLRRVALVERWAADPYILNTPIGAIDLRTGKPRVLVLEDRIRRCTAVAPKFEEPARYLEMLDGIFAGRPDYRQAWLDWQAISLIGESVRRTALVVEGPGGNGKSVLFSVCRAMLGNTSAGGYALMLDSTKAFDQRVRSRMSHTSDLVLMDQARMVLLDEVARDFEPDEALLKSAISGGDIVARQIFGKSYTFPFTASLSFATNVPIHFHEDIPALRNRFFTMTLTRIFPDNARLRDAVLAEAPQILGMAVRRCAAILQGAPCLWLPDSWTPDTSPAFAAMTETSNLHFELADPVPGMLRRMLLKDPRGVVWARDLGARVRAALERVRERSDEELPALDALLASSDRAIEVRIARTLRSEYGLRSKVAGPDRLKAYMGIAFLLNPSLPFDADDDSAFLS